MRRRGRDTRQTDEPGRPGGAEERPWSPVPRLQVLALAAGMGTIFLLLVFDKPPTSTGHFRALIFLHDINLVFHEAGHVIFSPLGRTITILGGTLMQLGVPLAVAISFYKRRDAAGYAVCGFWLAENFVDVSVYIADARALKLPLINNNSSETHDWHNLLGDWGLLGQDTAIAWVVAAIGWLGMVYFLAFVGWRYTETRREG
jgi:hypothetical protein